MKTVQSVDKVTIKLNKNELINGRWLNFNLLSAKLAKIEEDEKMKYKQLRNKLYNSRACGKYDVDTVAGMRCINVEEPMKGKASLELSFEVTE